MIMHLDYKFTYDGQEYHGLNVDIGETVDLEYEIETTTIDDLKIDAICHAFDITIDEYEEQKYNIDNFQFEYCELNDGY